MDQQTNEFGVPLDELANPFTLAAVTSSKGFGPQKIVLYGVPGIGKTTFAATFPAPIMLRTEDGAGALDVPTFPRTVRTLKDLDLAMQALCGDHPYRTLVIDSLDWLEPIVWRYVCADGGKESIEDFGYGKGYVKVDAVWQRIHTKLEKLRERGMHIVAIAHADAKMFEPPDMDAYTRYGLKLHKRGSALWQEWADMVLFANYRTHTITPSADSKNKAVKAYGNGDRVLYTAERPAFQAKNRVGLPHEIMVGQDKGWQSFHDELSAATDGAYSNK